MIGIIRKPEVQRVQREGDWVFSGAGKVSTTGESENWVGCGFPESLWVKHHRMVRVVQKFNGLVTMAWLWRSGKMVAKTPWDGWDGSDSWGEHHGGEIILPFRVGHWKLGGANTTRECILCGKFGILGVHYAEIPEDWCVEHQRVITFIQKSEA